MLESLLQLSYPDIHTVRPLMLCDDGRAEFIQLILLLLVRSKHTLLLLPVLLA